MSRAGAGTPVPGWVDLALIPAINLALALLATGVVILIIGEDPIRALGLLIQGSLTGSAFLSTGEALGYTVYYATTYVFTALAVAVAFHCGLFNIGGEGQAYIGGLGIGLAALSFDFLPGLLVAPLVILGGALFGAGWAFLPGYLQAKRGSHIVITTIMFNFIAASLMVYLMVNVLIRPGQQSPESRPFAEHVTWPPMNALLEPLGLSVGTAPLNVSVFWALICCVFVWVFIWRTRWGYALRTVGHNPHAAVYAGIDPARMIIIAMVISGALAGFAGLNILMGDQHRILLNFAVGFGFGGIAVSLMGRNHPVGIVLAALLFGMLTQGGSELAFEMPSITREMVVFIQGVVILFAGALEGMFRPQIEDWFRRRADARAPSAPASAD